MVKYADKLPSVLYVAKNILSVFTIPCFCSISINHILSSLSSFKFSSNKAVFISLKLKNPLVLHCTKNSFISIFAFLKFSLNNVQLSYKINVLPESMGLNFTNFVFRYDTINVIKAYTIIATTGCIKLFSSEVDISAAIDPIVIVIK